MELYPFERVEERMKDIRQRMSILSDEDFVKWFSRRYQITEQRVLSILEELKEEANQ